jgi:hypothetical protein
MIGLLSAFWMVTESVLGALFSTTTSSGIIIGGAGFVLSELGRFNKPVQLVLVLVVIWGVLAEVSFLKRLWACFKSRLFPLPLQVGLNPPAWPGWIRLAFGSWWLLRFLAGFYGMVVFDMDVKANSTTESLVRFLVGAGWTHMALGYLLAALGTYKASAGTVRKVWQKRFWLDAASGVAAVILKMMMP